MLWGFGVGYMIFKILDMTIGLRVSDKDEDEGLDESEHGALAYPELLR